MNRLLRVASATVLLVGSLSVSQLFVPGLTVACSCIAPEPGAPAFTGDDDAVLIGTVGQADGRGSHAFAVERWFHGGNAAGVWLQSALQTFPDGQTAIDSCGLTFKVGERLILAAGRMDATTLRPGSCAPHALVASPEGQQLVAAAVRAFGEGTAPGVPPDIDPGADAAPDLGLVAIALVTFVVGLTAVAALLAFARRREPPPPDQP
ncbi:MAG TPA: hypothetical protein VMQ65_08370 [Candidatus Limnocylindria bacterium]|nr:hypothetical protein [Candidatus Limnocylindria bacterium]